MAEPWLLRSGRKDDVDAMYRLDLVCFDEPFRFTLRSMRRFVRAPGAVVIVAEANSALAGFVILHPTSDSTAYVVTLDVAPEYRRRGLASALIVAAGEAVAAQGIKNISLHVHAGNTAALSFYERNGYRRTALHTGFYAEGLDGWGYTKTLVRRDEGRSVPQVLEV